MALENCQIVSFENSKPSLSCRVRKTPPPRISKKKLAQLDGRVPFSSITSPRQPTTRSGTVKRKRRTPSEYARIYGSKSRVSWVKSLPCVYCNAIGGLFGALSQGKCHNAHTITGGMGRKADYDTIVPMCHSHHRRYDDYLKPFDTEDVRDAIKRMARVIAAAWDSHQARKAA